MTTPPSTDPKLTAGNETPASPGFEENLHSFWAKNRNAVFVFCALVLVAIVGKEGWAYFSNQKQESVSEAYALATTPDKLRTFAKKNAGQSLAGLAHLSLADDAYSARKYSEAATEYEQAASSVKVPALVGRAKLGLAMSQIQNNQATQGEVGLKQLANDATQFKAVRAEAAYQLASLAAAAGKVDDVKKLAEQIMQLDTSGVWAQRAMMLQASLPQSPVPTTTAPTPDKKDGGINIKLPGK